MFFFFQFIKIFCGDGLPQQICAQCLNSLTQFNRFWVICKKSQESLINTEKNNTQQTLNEHLKHEQENTTITTDDDNNDDINNSMDTNLQIYDLLTIEKSEVNLNIENNPEKDIDNYESIPESINNTTDSVNDEISDEVS